MSALPRGMRNLPQQTNGGIIEHSDFAFPTTRATYHREPCIPARASNAEMLVVFSFWSVAGAADLSLSSFKRQANSAPLLCTAVSRCRFHAVRHKTPGFERELFPVFIYLVV